MGDPCGIGIGCFVAGTEISTPGGSVPIEELRNGDSVVSIDSDGNATLGTVFKTYKVINYGFVEINETLKVTATHPFLVSGRWKNAGEIRVGDRLTRADGSEMIVSSVDYRHRGVRTYNIEVSDTHTFLANGFVVHNKGGFGE